MTIRTITIPVKDLDLAAGFYRTLLGVDPDVEQPYHVGFHPDDAPEITLDPHGDVAAGPVAYYEVDDIETSTSLLLAAGATVERSAHDIGDALLATLRDADGNLVGLYQALA
jgi:predicted enzyme related to lactoylglutathione lyase